MRICVFEDGGVAGFEPVGLTRPLFDLRCGALTLRERQERWFGAAGSVALAAADRAAWCRLACPEVRLLDPAAPLPNVVALVNARWLPAEAVADEAPERGVYLAGDEVAYAVFSASDFPDRAAADVLARLARELPHRPARGTLVRHAWELIDHNAAALEQDAAHWRATRASTPVPAGVTVIGPPESVYVDPAARVEPLAVLDTTRGPVLVDGGAVVQSFSRLDGPCYVGPRTQVLAARVRGSSFGPECRVGGEVETTIVQGYSNKAHDGFLGHSYLGEWVNLGAGTITSDLRTDYGPVSVPVGGRSVATGLMKVGAFIGDHVKTSIGTLLNTGTAVGPFGLLLTSGTLLPREIPAFCRYGHGRMHERSDPGQMFETAAVALGRRGREWTDAHAEAYLDLFERTAAVRLRILRENEQRRLRRVI